MLNRIASIMARFGFPLGLILLIALSANGQTPQQTPATVQQTPKTTFSQNMNLAGREINWSQTYFQSFHKTGETTYLDLAAKHCINAIKVLKATQTRFPNTTRFYYMAKNKRFDACKLYETLQEAALRLGAPRQMQDLTAQECDF